jgi:hypothetical protein
MFHYLHSSPDPSQLVVGGEDVASRCQDLIVMTRIGCLVVQLVGEAFPLEGVSDKELEESSRVVARILLMLDIVRLVARGEFTGEAVIIIVIMMNVLWIQIEF